MAGSLAERLQLVVDATTDGAEASFARLTGAARETGTTAERTAGQVAAAADRVAQAKAKEADAADTVRVAEIRLQELHDKGNASASQIARAESQVERARRNLHLATREVTSATEAQTAANEEAINPTEQAGDAAEGMSLNLKDLAATAAGLIGGISLADWARDAVTGFMDGARAASDLAVSMNATIGQGGQLAQVFTALGLEAGDLLEIQASFAQVVGESPAALSDMGAAVQRNRDGTVNWATTLQDAIAQLQQIPDATERNATGFRLFGEEGYKQLSQLVNSSTDVRDAFEAVGQPFTEEDVRAVAEYDSAMLELNLTSGELGRTIGRAVVPLMTGLIDAGQTVADVIGAIPGPIAATAAAALLLGFAMRSAAVEGGFLAGALTAVTTGMTAMTGRAIAATTSLAAMRAAGGAAGRGLMNALGGPLGLALIGVGVGIAVVTDAVDDFETNARRLVVESESAGKGMGKLEESSEDLGRKLLDESGAVEGWIASLRGADLVVADLTEQTGTSIGPLDSFMSTLLGTADSVFDLGIAEAGATAEIDAQREALGEATLQQEAAQVAVKGLSDLIAEGTTSGDAFATAVRGAAEAQAAEARTSDLASAALAAYNAVTDGAVQATYDLLNAQLSSEDANFGYLDSLDELVAAKDDEKTSVDEVAQAHNRYKSSALNAASAVADAAVETARQAGTILTPLAEAQIRADAMIGDLREKLNRPGLSEGARVDLEALVGQLEAAKANGNVEALVSLTGATEAADELDQTTEDRETQIQVESRGGPAVVEYLDRITNAVRLSIIRVESRGGPAVLDYLRGLADAQRLALIRVESRGGPDVDGYLDGLASQYRLAIIHVETRGGPAVDEYLDNLAGRRRVAIIDAQRGTGLPSLGSGTALRGAPGVAAAGAMGATLRTVELDLKLTGTLDRAQLSRAERGRAHVEDIRAYEQRNGTGWRRTT